MIVYSQTMQSFSSLLSGQGSAPCTFYVMKSYFWHCPTCPQGQSTQVSAVWFCCAGSFQALICNGQIILYLGGDHWWCILCGRGIAQREWHSCCPDSTDGPEDDGALQWGHVSPRRTHQGKTMTSCILLCCQKNLVHWPGFSFKEESLLKFV